MNCPYCDVRYAEEIDPYGTGDNWYVLYEPQCDCELRLERQPDSVSTLKQAVLENHNEYINNMKLEENK